MTYIIWPEGATKFQDRLGGKARALAALTQAGFCVPAWFLILPQAFYASLTPDQLAGLMLTGSQTQAGEPFISVELNPRVKAELAAALARLCPQEELVAVRSSALEEDGNRTSFAGQFDSFLNVPPGQIASFVIRVWRSGFSDRARAYRREQGLDLAASPPAVLVQRMVKARKSGVAFSVDPVTGRRDMAVIGAVTGLGTALVSGQVDADTYRVDRSGQITEFIQGTEPVHRQNGQRPVLNNGEIHAVAQLARQTEQFFGWPQDIEWAVDGQGLYLLQSRPVTRLPDYETPATRIDQDGPIQVWDNSNIAESYPGVTSPLTFSFVRRAYGAVYRQFCHLMGVPGQTIDAEAATFGRMLGLIQGRIYYNLVSWYRVLSLLPGYKLNRGFMEQMMGVKRGLPAALLPEPVATGRGARLLDSLFLLRTVTSLIINFASLHHLVRTFYRRLNRALGDTPPALSDYSPAELVDYYRQLEGQLLTRWDAPLVNDFFTMIFYGVLRHLTQHWCQDETGSLQHRLLANTGGIVSVEPVFRLKEMASQAGTDEILVKLLREEDIAAILAQLPRWPEFQRQFQAYLQKFGDRCLEELKLESPTLHDDPLLLLRTTGQMAHHNNHKGQQSTTPGSVTNGEQAGASQILGDWDKPGGIRGALRTPRSPRVFPKFGTHPEQAANADQAVRRVLVGRPLRRLIFYWVLRNTRKLVRNRENLRFERTRLFGRARLIFVELGRRFQAAGLIAEPRDIFYLEVEEILGAVDGTTTTCNLSGLVSVRKSEFETFRSMPPPPDRFETQGLVAKRQQPAATGPGGQPTASSLVETTRRGLGCSPGVVRGPVRVIINPREAALKPGEILVAKHTDPGWIILFSGAAGVLVEHGSLLSHAAIVSREMSLPAVVSLAGVTRWLKNGDWVEFDGSTGLVRKIESPVSAAVQPA